MKKGMNPDYIIKSANNMAERVVFRAWDERTYEILLMFIINYKNANGSGNVWCKISQYK